MHYLKLIDLIGQRVGRIEKVIVLCPFCDKETMIITLSDRSVYCPTCHEHGSLDYILRALSKKSSERDFQRLERSMQLPPGRWAR